MSQTVKRLAIRDREFILVGTAHISAESVEEVQSVIREENPDSVAVELDSQRYESLKDPEAWRKLNITNVLKSGQGFVLLANLVLSSFQRRLGLETGVKPGQEMLSAVELCEGLSIPIVLADRPIAVTLRRAWMKTSLWGKCKLLASLISSAFETETIAPEEIENLKKTNEMDTMMGELANYLPAVKTVLIDERDLYLASNIWTASGKKTVAVVGAGHMPGIERWLNSIADNAKNPDTAEISQIPPKSMLSRVIVWLIPALILGLLVIGFIQGGADVTRDMLLRWLLTNGTLAAIGAVIALGHPLAVLVSFVGAPITSLNPFIGIGMVSGLVQAWVRKPKVEDMELLQKDALSLKGFYKNRILRVLLVFFLSSIGSSIGTFAAISSLIGSIVPFFR